ncbi:MAG: NAD(P)/FAD-dependent oxidoreductase, partial [Candidatus Thermoplasmatota archaeon]|nr:NAD(P)/FAD-dependent oxidoreductase [Candidatus Thermoplasmatota archaeon]
DHMLEKELRDNAKKDSINVLAQLVPQRLAALLFHISEIEPSKKAANVSREERKAVTKLLKQLSAHVSGVGGFDRAMVTAGGVDIKEIRPETMGSKLFENLYFAGEVLGMEGPSGGYNLQMAWSTGRLAGESAARAKEK